MENENFYSRKEIPQAEIERLKNIEYPNFVSETLLNNLDLEGKKLLDSGAGSNAGLAEFVAKKKGMYVPIDLRTDMLKVMQSKLEKTDAPFYGIQSDVKAMPFADKAFDFVHQRFVLMNIPPADRKHALEELLRVSKEEIILIEYNWRTLKSTENPKMIEEFRNIAFKIFSKFSTDPYMGEKLNDLLEEISPSLDYSLQSFKREEDVANTPELILNLRGFSQIAKNVLADQDLLEKCEKLIEKLGKTPLKFSPPEVVTALIKKS